MDLNEKLLKMAKNVFCGLLILNLTSVFISKSGGAFNSVSYAFRILLYTYVLCCIRKCVSPKAIKNTIFAQYGIWIPILLTISLLGTIAVEGEAVASISKIFPTYFMLADTLLFFYIGFSLGLSQNHTEKLFSYFRIFSVLSIIGMSFLSVYVVVFMGGLQAFWDEARSANHAYDVILNVYKNVNPYRFAVLIPFLFLIKSKWNVPLSVVAVINIILAGKKGPLLAMLLAGFLIFVFLKGDKIKFLKYVLIALCIFYAYYMFVDDSVFNTLVYRLDMSQHHKQDDTSFYMSGRNNLWRFVLESFYSSSIFNQIFGFGINGASNFLIAKTGINNAHNDWLEMLYNFGYVGFFVNLNLYFVILQICRHLKRFNKFFFLITLYLVVFSFISSFYTVEFYGGLAAPGYCFILIASLYGIYYRNRYECAKK